MTDRTPAPLGPGSVIGGDFRITSKIAEGGMGMVFAAEQISTRRVRAVKVMQPALVLDTRMRERFLQEAWVVAQLESDHAVDVVAAGVDEGSGMPWLAMELLRGETLDAYVARRGPLPVDELRELALQARHVLSQAHRVGLIHRDLKPENMFVCTPRRVGVPFTLKILDFGIAKFLQESRQGLANSQAMGSPLWMAPEQWRPSAAITPAADVWALALVMFFAITGQPFWRGAAKMDIAELLLEILGSPLVPPSARAAEIAPGVALPDGFDAWFTRCLAREPDARYPNADKALEAFDQLLGPPAYNPATGTGPRPATGRLTVPSAPQPARSSESPTRLADGPTTALSPPAVRAAQVVPAPARAAPMSSQQLWAALTQPSRRQEHVARVALALGPTLAELWATTPALAGLSEQWRTNRAAARVGARGTPALLAAESALVETHARMSLPEPRVYLHAEQAEPLRVVPTVPPSFVLGGALGGLSPVAVAQIATVAAAVSRPELSLRAFVTDVAQLRRVIQAATAMVQGRAPRGAAGLLVSDLRERLESRPDVLVCLEEHGAGCTEEAVADWVRGVDESLARVGMAAVPAPEALDVVFAHWPLALPCEDPAVVKREALVWIESPQGVQARAAWQSWGLSGR